MIILSMKHTPDIILQCQTKKKMMKTKPLIISIAAFLIGAAATNARIIRRQLNILQTNVPETKTLAEGYLEFIYDYTFNADTLYNSQTDREKMLLQVGTDGISKYSSLKNIVADSIIPTLSQEELVKNAERLANGPFINIVKNHSAGKITPTEKIALDWFKYEEDIPQFDWTLTDSVRTVLGYECRQAKCRFRGRDWTVFYTEEIPVMDGPWKLCGLPGLIMSAHDEKSLYAFECIGVKSNTSRPITIYDVSYNETNRKKFYDTLHRYESNPYGYAETVSGIHVTITDNAGNPDPTAYDPIELGYDYLERDWREK